MKYKYPNLEAEMIRQNVSIQTIADTIGVEEETAKKKIKGKLRLMVPEGIQIASLFGRNNTVEYLFATRE